LLLQLTYAHQTQICVEKQDRIYDMTQWCQQGHNLQGQGQGHNPQGLGHIPEGHEHNRFHSIYTGQLMYSKVIFSGLHSESVGVPSVSS